MREVVTVYNKSMEKQSGVMETSFWVLGHRVDVLSYLFRFFTIFVPEDVEIESISVKSHAVNSGHAIFILKGDSMPDDKYEVKDVTAI